MELLTADQAATVLDVPAQTIRRWHRAGLVVPAGLLPSRGRSGRVALFTLHELTPLADANRARKTRRTERVDRTPVRV